MADDPVDLTFVDGVDVSKASVRDLLKNYVELRVAQPSTIQGNDFSGRAGGIYVRSNARHYLVDLTDTTTADDAEFCLVDSAGNRWKAIAGSGTAMLDFGGADTTSLEIEIPTIESGAILSVQVQAADTDDRDADEHWIDPPLVVAGAVTEGEGFTIYGAGRYPGHRPRGSWTVVYHWNN